MQVAIKFLERGAGVSRGVVREVLNHRLCVAHPNIAQFKEVRARWCCCCRCCVPNGCRCMSGRHIYAPAADTRASQAPYSPQPPCTQPSAAALCTLRSLS